MRDNLDPQEPRATPGRANSSETPASRPMADREVPITGHQTPSSIHAWLNGEISESEVRHGEAVHDVEFWLHIDREVEVRRRMKTPVHVYESIMEALPQGAPRTATSWWSRSFPITPVVAVAATAGALAVGAVLGATVLRSR